ncbi:MAG: hypothetical protein QCI82_11880 [Candidatus Thermoplasmatota archaeon]|nr:hypothetical protein [Candidatus Thermoplasmatota archaeon]
MKNGTDIIIVAIVLCMMPIAACSGGYEVEPSGWGVAELIEHDDMGSAGYPDIGTDAEGNAIAVWNHNDGSVPQIVANRYTKGVGWEDAEFLTAGGFNSLSPRIAVNGNGNATVVWRYSDGIRYNVVARNYFPGIGWDTGYDLETMSGDVQNPQVDMNDDGYAIAVWSQDDGTYHSIYANVYTPGTGWGSAELVENGGDGAYAPQVVLSPDGVAVVVWYQSNGAMYDIWANTYTITAGWGDAELIETYDTGNAFGPMIDMDGSGNAMAVWRQQDGTIYNVVSNRYTSGSGWGTAEIIETGDGQVQPPTNVALDDDGNALATWSQWDGSKYNIISNRFTPSEGWGEEERIDHGDETSETSHTAMDAAGNAIAVWRQYDGGFYSIYANRFVKGSGWGKAELIETRIGSADVPRVSVDPSGDAIAVWYHSDGYRTNIWSNRYMLPDTTPPVLTLSSPENGIEVDTNVLTVSGTTESGAALVVNGVNAYVAEDGTFSIDISLFPGSNTIVVTSTDASGNHAVETRTVTYTDPMVDKIASLTDAMDDLSLSLLSIFGNISDIEDEIASIKEMMGSMNDTDNTSSIIDELEILSMELQMTRENLTQLKERLTAIEGEGNETVDLSGILDMIDALEYDLDRNDAEISDLKNDVGTLKEEDPAGDEWKDEASSLRALVIVLGATLFVAIIMGILLFIIMMIMIVRRKGHRIEE